MKPEPSSLLSPGVTHGDSALLVRTVLHSFSSTTLASIILNTIVIITLHSPSIACPERSQELCDDSALHHSPLHLLPLTLSSLCLPRSGLFKVCESVHCNFPLSLSYISISDQPASLIFGPNTLKLFGARPFVGDQWSVRLYTGAEHQNSRERVLPEGFYCPGVSSRF